MHVQNRKQRGAALVVGLLLLVVLTLLAISGMNTASTELVMAGNEQYRAGAAQAAETGIEQQLDFLRNMPPDSDPVPVDNVDLGNGTKYSTLSTYRDEGPIPGSSSDKFVGFFYDIRSTAQGARNATAVQNQGVYVVNSSGK